MNTSTFSTTSFCFLLGLFMFMGCQQETKQSQTAPTAVISKAAATVAASNPLTNTTAATTDLTLEEEDCDEIEAADATTDAATLAEAKAIAEAEAAASNKKALDKKAKAKSSKSKAKSKGNTAKKETKKEAESLRATAAGIKKTPKPKPAPDAPIIAFANDTYSFGMIAQGTKKSYRFPFKNEGKKPLIIENADVTCGCTVAQIPQAPILPGETAYIDVEYDSKGKIGEQNKVITLTTNAYPRTHKLFMKGLVVSEGFMKKKQAEMDVRNGKLDAKTETPTDKEAETAVEKAVDAATEIKEAGEEDVEQDKTEDKKKKKKKRRKNK